MRRRPRIFLPGPRLRAVTTALVLGGGLLAAPGRADTPEARFEAARAAYDRGDLATAVAEYEALLAEGVDPMPVYFNLGNTLYRMGRTGEAMWAWHRARVRAPRDPEILANLDLAERITGAPPFPQPFPASLFRQVSEAAWRRGLVSAWWVGLLALAAIHLRPALGAGLRPVVVLALLTAVGGLAGLGSWRILREQDPVVVVAETPAQARFAPLDTATPSMVLPPGTWARTVDRRDGWIEVERDDQRGWIRKEHARQVLPETDIAPALGMASGS